MLPPTECSRLEVLYCPMRIPFHLYTVLWRHTLQKLLAVQAVTLDVEDLEADATPEDLMLSYVSGEKGKVLHRMHDTFLA